MEVAMERVKVVGKDEPISLREAALPGILAGLFAAFVMGGVWMLFAFREGDVWRPMKAIAAMFLGQRALQASGFQPVPVLLGFAIHLTMGILLAVFFSWLGGYLNMGAAMGWGLVFGLALWVIMQFGLLPAVNPWMTELPPVPFALSHALFGLSLGTYPRFLPKQRADMPQILRKAA
jgi:uncharacterized membrane protein YagU involved in acid resistance